MNFSDDMAREQKESAEWRHRQAAKLGEYTGEDCPHCSRNRVMVGSDGKRRCEKCCWCIEDNNYDMELLDYSK